LTTCNCGSKEVSEKEVALQELLDHYRDYQGALIPVLQEAQNIYGYLPTDVLEKIAQELRIPFSKVFGVCTFYAQFHLKPRGKYIVRMCLGTACHVRGGAKIFKALGDQLGVSDGGTTPDLKFTLESVACIGACGLAPCLMVNDDTHGRLTVSDVAKILAQYE